MVGTGRLIVVSALAISCVASSRCGAQFDRHVVVAVERHAAEAGRDALRSAGNAIDAAVATALALAVTHPSAGNLGGGGFLVVFESATKEVHTVDFREAAPRASTPTMYLDPEGRLLPGHRAGLRAGGVPGTVRGLSMAHRRWGRLPWRDLVEPAARLARDGFPISATLARSLNEQLAPRPAADDAQPASRSARLADFPASVAAFARPDGAPWSAGDLLVQPDLGRTLDRIAAQGPDDFYDGETARLIVAAMRREGGLISRADLAGYTAVVRPPVVSSYRGHTIHGMGPPSSGGIVNAIELNLLERYRLREAGPGDPVTLHRVTEAMKRAYAVRALELGDPELVAVPIERLCSRAYADGLAATIGARATDSRTLAPGIDIRDESAETTHLSVLDCEGGAVALTYTLEESFGSKAVVSGAGFLLNNEMGDFNLIPGRTDTAGRIGTEANRIAPGKRMLSSQAPTIVLEDDQVRIVTGSPGGRTIPNTVLWVVLNRLEFAMEPAAAVAAARTHHAWLPDVLELEGPNWSQETRESLRRMGHRLGRRGVQGDAHSIMVDAVSGRIDGVADGRSETSFAAGD